jgi:hypothetical protein
MRIRSITGIYSNFFFIGSRGIFLHEDQERGQKWTGWLAFVDRFRIRLSSGGWLL